MKTTTEDTILTRFAPIHLRPSALSMIRWTTIYRRLNKKGVTEEVAKKRSRRTVKHERAIAGASWDAIRAKRNQKPDARAAARQAAIAKSKESKKAAQAAKKA
ncbi:hypothetical protein [Absidia glauca]|uniref:60S ribosomal protein L24 n=1 Tax=Absidia glauca TaxID=4829 RepID=A0A163K1K2_ABSGL|nr:hypothetical protein [Absidia glauca]